MEEKSKNRNQEKIKLERRKFIWLFLMSKTELIQNVPKIIYTATTSC